MASKTTAQEHYLVVLNSRFALDRILSLDKLNVVSIADALHLVSEATEIHRHTLLLIDTMMVFTTGIPLL